MAQSIRIRRTVKAAPIARATAPRIENPLLKLPLETARALALRAMYADPTLKRISF